MIAATLVTFHTPAMQNYGLMITAIVTGSAQQIIGEVITHVKALEV